MRKTRLLAAVAAVATLAIGGVGSANATPVYGYAELAITNFSLNLGGATVDSFSVLGSDGATYPGYAPAGNSASGNIVSGVDAPQAFTGPGPAPAENTFTQQLLATTGARGDMLIAGPITGANATLVAESNLGVGGATSSGDAGSGTTLKITFTTGGGSVGLTFNASEILRAAVSTLGDTANAQASLSGKICNTATNVCVNITDNLYGESGTSVSPNALNQNVSSQTPGQPGTYTLASTPFSYSATLGAGQYQITLTDHVGVILTSVPEPASLAVVGSALIGLAFLRRRNKRKAIV